MKGYRGFILVLVDVVSSALLLWAGIQYGTDLVGLATALGAKSAGVVGGVAARGYSKKGEADLIKAQNGHGGAS